MAHKCHSSQMLLARSLSMSANQLQGPKIFERRSNWNIVQKCIKMACFQSETKMEYDEIMYEVL
eukprot:Pgem_evm1s10226